MCAPASGAGDNENRREHVSWYPHLPVGHSREPVEIWEHFLQFPHGAFQTVGDVVHLQVAVFFCQLLGNAFDDHVTRVSNGVNRMPETDNDFLLGNALADVGFGFVGTVVTSLDALRFFVCSTVFGAAQCADSTRDAGIHIGIRACNDASSEGGGVEFVFGVQD